MKTNHRARIVLLIGILILSILLLSFQGRAAGLGGHASFSGLRQTGTPLPHQGNDPPGRLDGGQGMFLPLVVKALPTPEPTATSTSLPPASDCRVNKLSGTTNPEYVIIKNFGPGAQDMTGWTLVSVVGPQTFHFPAGYVLNPEATVRIESYSAGTNNPPAVLLWTRSAIWSNTGEKAQLINPDGVVVSWKCYGNKCP